MPFERPGDTTAAVDGLLAMSIDRRGVMTLLARDGVVETMDTQIELFGATSMIERLTHVLPLSLLFLRTVRGDEISVELPTPSDSAPVRGRPVIYLDQNHWSTISRAACEPGRVRDADERAAALRVIELADERSIVLPMSLAHMVETSKQADFEERYWRALTIAKLSRGWQFRDPLELRGFELQQALSVRFHGATPRPLAAVTLEPTAAHGVHATVQIGNGSDLPDGALWVNEIVSSAASNFDVMLDIEHVPVTSTPGWSAELQRFARFMAENPTGPEVKRRRTHAKFIADLGNELPEGAYRARITPEQMSEWTLHHSEVDLRTMPSLGLYREVMHEKLCNPTLPWEENDLTDMNYLAAGSGYCDHVVGERRHAAFLETAVRRLDRTVKVHRNLRSLVEVL